MEWDGPFTFTLGTYEEAIDVISALNYMAGITMAGDPDIGLRFSLTAETIRFQLVEGQITKETK